MSIHMPTRGGTRGGQDQFEWEDVKVDKDRENYLGEIGAFPLKDFTSDRSRQFFHYSFCAHAWSYLQLCVMHEVVHE